MILINCPIAPPADLLEQSIKTGNTEALAEWFIGQTSPGYSFQTIVPEPDNLAISFLLSESGMIFFRVTIPPEI